MTPNSSNSSYGRFRVLIADDHVGYFSEMAALLRGSGYDCTCVPDGLSADAHLQSGSVDVLVADIRMPGNTQLELVLRAQRLPNPPAVILMTGFPTLETAIYSVKLRISAYLVKPFGYHELLEEVRVAAEERDQRTTDIRALRGPIANPPAGPRSQEDFALDHPEIERLTKREYDVLSRVLLGCDVSGVAGELFISPHTVRNHLKAIYRKLDVRSRVELVVRFAVRDSSPPRAVSLFG